MKTSRAAWLVRLAPVLAALSSGCKEAPSPSPASAPASWVQSVRKLEGAPARVMSAQFAPDGGSVLVFEGRRKKGASAAEFTFAVSRRPIAGGPGKDLLVSDASLIDYAVLGDGIVVLQRPSIPKGNDEDDLEERSDARHAALEKTALYRVVEGGAPVRVSPEGRRCTNVVESAGGQWVAFSLAPGEELPIYKRYDWQEEETHVLGAKPGEEITLAVKGHVHAISPDGGRVLIQRKPEGLVMVTVKDQAVTVLPTSLMVDGAPVDMAGLFVSFSGDGLLFRSAKGDLYRSALNGLNAQRLAGALPEAADAGAPEDGGAPADAGAPVERTRRVIGPKGTVFELREEAGAVVLSLLGATEPIAKFEGPLSSLSDVAFDAAEKRIALAILSDTSRDGVFDVLQDDAEIFVTDAAAGSLSFGRAPVTLLVDELEPKMVAAAGSGASSVSVTSARGSVEVTAELPWVEGEKAQALLDRLFVAARAMIAARTQEDVSIRLRVGSLEIKVYPRKVGDNPPHLTLVSRGIAVGDPEATSLVLRDSVRTSFWGSSNQTVAGTLENTGKEPTAPIEVFSTVTSGYGESKTHREIKKELGSIAPGKRVRFELILPDVAYGAFVHAKFRAGDKRLVVVNQYAHDHSVDWLDAALEVRAAHGVWSEHGEGERDASLVHLTPEQAALPVAEREALMRKIANGLKRHNDKFHRGDYIGVNFAAAGGGGWRLEEGKKIERYEAGSDKPGRP